MARHTQQWTVDVDGRETVACFEPAERPSGDVLVLAHGAGGHMNHGHIVDLARVVRGCGLDVVRFNFLYRAAGKGPPDRMPVLQSCFAAVAEHARGQLDVHRLFIGGHSMGGRAASMMAAEACGCAGLMLLSYPLHPAGKPGKLRSAHLADIGCAVLSLSGTRDKLCEAALMDDAIAGMDHWTHHWIAEADHGLDVLKRSGRTRADVLEEISQVMGGWLSARSR